LRQLVYRTGDIKVPFFIWVREMKTTINHVSRLLDDKFEEEAYRDFFIVEIKMPTPKRMEVFIDSDTTLNISQLARLNRYLQKHIDEAGWLGEVYTLDVSSPGVGALKVKRQYQKNIGRKVEVRLNEGKPETGILTTVEEHQITLQQEKTFKEGKKKIKQQVQTPIPFDNIKQTIVKISF